MIVRPDRENEATYGLDVALRDAARQRRERSAYEKLGIPAGEAEAYSILGPQSYEINKKYGADSSSTLDRQRIKYDAANGTGSFDARLSKQRESNTNQQMQPSYVSQEQEPVQQPQQVKKQSELLDRLNTLAGHYQNRLMDANGLQQPQSDMPSRQQMLGGQFPQGFMQQPQQTAEQSMLKHLLGAQGREESRLAAEQMPQQAPMQEPMMQQEPAQNKQSYEPTPDSLREAADQLSSFNNPQDKKDISDLRSRANKLEVVQDKRNKAAETKADKEYFKQVVWSVYWLIFYKV